MTHTSADPLTSTPITAALFAALVEWVDATWDILALTGNGEGVVSLATWRKARRALRIAEGLFRRIVLVPATALADGLAETVAAPVLRAKSAAPREIGDGAKPKRGKRLFPLLRLHELASAGQRIWRPSRPALSDPSGTVFLSLKSEFARYAALVVAIEAPDGIIDRLARILLRRRRRAAAEDHPVDLQWGTPLAAPNALDPENLPGLVELAQAYAALPSVRAGGP